jgi:hypothetical protein
MLRAGVLIKLSQLGNLFRGQHPAGGQLGVTGSAIRESSIDDQRPAVGAMQWTFHEKPSHVSFGFANGAVLSMRRTFQPLVHGHAEAAVRQTRGVKLRHARVIVETAQGTEEIGRGFAQISRG